MPFEVQFAGMDWAEFGEAEVRATVLCNRIWMERVMLTVPF